MAAATDRRIRTILALYGDSYFGGEGAKMAAKAGRGFNTDTGERMGGGFATVARPMPGGGGDTGGGGESGYGDFGGAGDPGTDAGIRAP